MNEKQLCPPAMAGGKSVECARKCRTCPAEDARGIAEGLFAIKDMMFDVFGDRETGDALRAVGEIPAAIGSIADAIDELEASHEVE